MSAAEPPRREGACTAAYTRPNLQFSEHGQSFGFSPLGDDMKQRETDNEGQCTTLKKMKTQEALTCLQISIPHSPFNKVYQIINKTVIEKKNVILSTIKSLVQIDKISEMETDFSLQNFTHLPCRAISLFKSPAQRPLLLWSLFQNKLAVIPTLSPPNILFIFPLQCFYYLPIHCNLLFTCFFLPT